MIRFNEFSKRVISLGLISVMILALCIFAAPGVAFADEAGTVKVNTLRIAGANRYGTSQQAFKAFQAFVSSGSTKNVVIASGENFADALSGAYFAYKKNAALILTDKNDDYCVSAFLAGRTLGKNTRATTNVYILGGTSAVSKQAEDLIRLSALSVTRIGGANRYDTNLKVLNQTSGASTSDIIVCYGENFADALSASGVRLPILLVNSKLSQAQKDFLAKNRSRNIYVAGGDAAVNTQVYNELASYGNVMRFDGANRYDTSYRIAKYFYGDGGRISKSKGVTLAAGTAFADGLSAGPIAMKKGYPILLVSDGNTSRANKFVSENGIGNAIIMGGTGAISGNLATAVLSTAASGSKPASDLTSIAKALSSDSEKPPADVSTLKRKAIRFAMNECRLFTYQDCVALVRRSYREGAGLDLLNSFHGPHRFVDPKTEAIKSTTIIPASKAEPGDILDYPGHVALYIGKGMAVHGGFTYNGRYGTRLWFVTTGTARDPVYVKYYWHIAV